MKIGYPNHPRKPLVEEIEWIGRSRFDFLDLFLEEDQAAPEKVRGRGRVGHEDLVGRG
jgi:hypothetical protein